MVADQLLHTAAAQSCWCDTSSKMPLRCSLFISLAAQRRFQRDIEAGMGLSARQVPLEDLEEISARIYFAIQVGDFDASL